jgi:uncharacterized membrane protein YdbT with pleckstrin-like domain
VITDQQLRGDAPPVTVRHRPRRPFRRRRAVSQPATTVRPKTAVALTEAERQRRLEKLTAYLVRTMRSCPAPGVAPFTIRDWLLIAAVVVLPYLVVFGAEAMAAAR